MLEPAAQPRSVPRIALVDLVRGVALSPWRCFHFCWDLAMFRLIEPSVMASAGMGWFARSIAASFLFLAGFSLYVAHHRQIRWPSFAKWWVKIAGATALITIAIWFATPDAFIFFGILNAIALASLLCGLAGIFYKRSQFGDFVVKLPCGFVELLRQPVDVGSTSGVGCLINCLDQCPARTHAARLLCSVEVIEIASLLSRPGCRMEQILHQPDKLAVLGLCDQPKRPFCRRIEQDRPQAVLVGGQVGFVEGLIAAPKFEPLAAIGSLQFSYLDFHCHPVSV